MSLAITMPTWLSDVLAVYGDMVVPALVTLLVAIVSWVAMSIKASAKVNSAKADLQIQALKDVANREDNKPELEKQAGKIEALERVVALQSEMFNLAFQNSNLTPEVKDNLTSLVNKIKYGTEEDLVKELESANAQLLEQIESLKQQLETPTTVVVKEDVKKRTRR